MPRATFCSRLWSRVDVRHPRECWPFEGTTATQGYGTIGRDDKLVRVHRATWEDFYGPIPEGMHVLHRCDNRACGNPYHLFLGRDRQNNDDMRAKGRHARGVRNGQAKLTDADVVAIRSSSDTQRVLAERYGVAQSQICRVRTGRRWCHVAVGGESIAAS